MKLGVLFSGGKDSCLALNYAKHFAINKKKQHEIVCLISIISEKEDSYMFHTPAIDTTKVQANCLNIPLIQQKTKGEKEDELKDLKKAIDRAKKEYYIDGIVTGAVGSTYQSSRIQKICDELDLWCFNPLWQKDQVELLNELVKKKFEIIIVGIFAYPLDRSWIGKKIDKDTTERLKILQEKYKLNPAGEGGEIETLTLDSPDFSKKIVIEDFKIEYENHAGKMIINKTKIVDKKQKKQ